MEASGYWLGPAVEVEQLTVNGVRYPVRRTEDHVYVVREGTRGSLPRTSCPFAYAHDERTGAWTKEGHILFKLEGKANESERELRLTHFDGRISLREEEAETSFIDFVYVRQAVPGGGETILLPQNDALRVKDGRYLVLHPGDRSDIEFVKFDPRPGASYTLVAGGYYLPRRVSAGGDR
jgi:hypothetical protein